jgi:hypothetical protein
VLAIPCVVVSCLSNKGNTTRRGNPCQHIRRIWCLTCTDMALLDVAGNTCLDQVSSTGTAGRARYGQGGRCGEGRCRAGGLLGQGEGVARSTLGRCCVGCCSLAGALGQGSVGGQGRLGEGRRQGPAGAQEGTGGRVHPCPRAPRPVRYALTKSCTGPISGLRSACPKTPVHQKISCDLRHKQG